MFEKIRVLIVDDEESSRMLIRMSIDWEKLGYKVIGEANNAEEALEFIEDELPDLVLTDIYMPYMDGLELSERILSQYPEVKVVVVTGHDDFEYAQRGIKAGVFDYIVKPIDEEEIEQTLKSVYNLIRSEREMKANYSQLKEQLEKERPYLKEKFIVELLYNYIDEQDYNWKKNFTGMETKSNCFQVTIIEVVAGRNEEQKEDKQVPYLCYLFIDYIRTIMSDMQGVETFVDHTNNIILLNSYKKNSQKMNKKLELIKRHILSHPGIILTMGVGEWHEGINRIKISYKEATEALAYKTIIGINQIITYDDLMISDISEERLSERWQDKLSLYIKGGIVEEALNITHQVFEEMMYQGNIQMKLFRLKAIQLVMIIINAMTEIGMNVEDKKITGEELFGEIFNGNTLPEIESVIYRYITEICKSINLEHSNKQKSIIDKINQYIDENLKEQLSLNIISDRFHLNKSYLSRIYKERTGITLGEYILSHRMELSMVLLRTTDMKAYEIAEKVGYMDPNYFGNSFKKFTGKSISDFRKKIK